MSATRANGFDKPTITCMHEIGHILNERNLGDTFWEKDSIMTGKATTGAEVSGYAAQNKKEFVAEVFAGLILGMTIQSSAYAGINGFRRTPIALITLMGNTSRRIDWRSR